MLAALAGWWVFTAVPAAGQAVCGEGTRGATAGPGGSAMTAGAAGEREAWPVPLDRPVTVHATSLPLRAVLDFLAREGRFRITYSSDLLPLDRPVCVSYERVPVGRALAELVRGAGLEPVAAGGDHVVLAPIASAAAVPEADVAEEGADAAEPVVVLDRMVVIGMAVGGLARSVAAPGTTLDAVKAAAQTSHTLPEKLNAAVPGVWVWDRSAASPLARYGSIRGASSFGASYPKVYIDGIEVANPQLMAHLTSDAIERVEVIRGPQGAALYGTDAISGVINIVTRHEDGNSGVPRLRLRSTAGFTESDHTSRAVVAQEHALTVRTGSGQRSASLHLAAGSLGDYAPGASSRHLTVSSNTRMVGERSVVTGVGRLYLERGGGGGVYGGDIGRLVVEPGMGEARPYSIRQYTIGMNGAIMGGDHVVHTIVFGMDGYHMTDVPLAQSFTDAGQSTAGGIAGGDATRATLRASTRVRLGAGGPAEAALTAAVEHSLLHERAISPGGLPSAANWRKNTGLITHVAGEILNALHLTGGVRLERNDVLDTPARYTLLPMLGGALAKSGGAVSVKLRGAYGKGIRPAGTLAETGGFTWQVRALGNALLDAVMEEQSGVEAGLDVHVGEEIALHVTRFDQFARGPVHSIGASGAADGLGIVSGLGAGPGAYAAAGLLGRGEIENRGWELQGSYARGRLSMGVAASLVDSRVRALAHGYSGELRPGDRLLGVPAWTASLTGMWMGERWSGSLTAYRAGDWINYDRVALGDGGLPGQVRVAGLAAVRTDGAWPSGEALRQFWRRYDGVTHLRASASWELRPYLALLFSGDNLLNRQGGGPDNASVRPGRTVTFGIRAAF